MFLKEMNMSIFNKVTKTFQWGQHTVKMETGEVARQASGAVLLDMDGTLLDLAFGPEPRKPEKAPAEEPSDAAWTELVGLVEAITDVHVKSFVTEPVRNSVSSGDTGTRFSKSENP